MAHYEKVIDLNPRKKDALNGIAKLAAIGECPLEWLLTVDERAAILRKSDSDHNGDEELE